MGCANSNHSSPATSAPDSVKKVDENQISSNEVSKRAESGSVTSTSRSLFKEKYTLGDLLGQGSYSVVRLGKRVADGGRVAVKIVTKRRLRKPDELSLRSEVSILQSLRHPNIVEVLDFIEDDEYFYVVLEYVSGGELFERLIEKEVYTEAEARDLFQVLLNTVKFCHDRGLIHRDIKPENILLLNKENDTSIKLADFGFAVQEGIPPAKQQAGTPGYLAPEIVHGLPHGKPVDCWSLGVVLFMIVGGYPPFYGPEDDQQTMYRKIVKCEYQFHPENWSGVSDEAKDLIRRFLTLDPKERITVDGALEHPWIRKPSQELMLSNLHKNLTIMKSFRKDRAAHAAALTANITIDAVRKLSGANLTKNMSINDVAIDVIRKVSGANLTNDTVIEAARKRSGINLPKSNSGASLSASGSKDAKASKRR